MEEHSHDDSGHLIDDGDVSWRHIELEDDDIVVQYGKCKICEIEVCRYYSAQDEIWDDVNE